MNSIIQSDTLNNMYDLNRLFLVEIRSCGEDILAELKFPVSVASALRAADANVLRLASVFPCALFRLELAEATAGRYIKTEQESHGWRVLELGILFCAWTLCRERAYQARLFFGLSPDELHLLRTMAPSDLPDIGLNSLRLRCAFANSAWFWQELLTEPDPEVRRQLALVALQPSGDTAEIRRYNQVAESIRRQ